VKKNAFSVAGQPGPRTDDVSIVTSSSAEQRPRVLEAPKPGRRPGEGWDAPSAPFQPHVLHFCTQKPLWDLLVPVLGQAGFTGGLTTVSVAQAQRSAPSRPSTACSGVSGR